MNSTHVGLISAGVFIALTYVGVSGVVGGVGPSMLTAVVIGGSTGIALAGMAYCWRAMEQYGLNQ